MKPTEGMPRRTVLWTLFKSCFVISACTFGGGLVIISMLQKKFVDDLHWIDADEVMDIVAIAQACPGVMAVNASIIIGYRIAGCAGALLTVLGTVTPPMVILTIISHFYLQFRSNRIVSLVLRGMQAGVVAVMLNVTVNMISNVLRGRDVFSFVLLILAIFAAVVLKMDIILVLLMCGIAGGAAACVKSMREKRERAR